MEENLFRMSSRDTRMHGPLVAVKKIDDRPVVAPDVVIRDVLLQKPKRAGESPCKHTFHYEQQAHSGQMNGRLPSYVQG